MHRISGNYLCCVIEKLVTTKKTNAYITGSLNKYNTNESTHPASVILCFSFFSKRSSDSVMNNVKNANGKKEENKW